LVGNPHFSDRYFELLSQLKTAQARVTLGKHSPQDTAQLQSIRLELSELEDQSLSLSTKKENYRFQNSLKDIQARLHRSELLLSFCLGKTKSFLWAVTVDDVELYELPKEAEIVQRAKRYSQALQNGHGDDSAGTELGRILFGQLDRKFWQKRDWLITEDGTAAGQIPYAALTDVSISGPHEPLIAHHSLRILPSELLLLLPDTARPLRRFMGVADPIYNLADTRRAADVHFAHASDTAARAGLGRLVGSDREIKAAAKSSGMPQQEILSGPEANGAALKNALGKTPELLHFAVHVVSPDGKPQEAALALSLTNDNLPELLTREAIAAYRVPGSLVVLSGCSSGQGKALPSAGLIGLSRAWLLAGAAAVVVSSWPIPDDSGEFFSAFYVHLQKTVTGSLAQRAAIALQEAQLDMQHSNGYRHWPSFWAAYSIFSKE
jgi:CHAT domain-containing protein